MHHDLLLLATFTMAILTAFLGGWLARKFGFPTLIGYLLAGMAIGPFTPGFVGDLNDISQLAEMGVIFMMFGVGLHFSLRDLWAVRRVALPGAVFQMLIATGIGVLLAQAWGWSLQAGLVLGLAISIASTVVLLRALTENDLLRTQHGKVAVGWLVLEDLATVAILVLLPVLMGGGEFSLANIGLAILKTVIFVALIMLVGARLLPWLLTQIAQTRSRELFILAVVALALGTAFAAAELFGVSLALGAFLAGVVIGESEISHEVGEEVVPFREIFAVLFFVSVGMLVNPAVIVANAGQVIVLSALIIVGKSVITLLLTVFLPASRMTALVVAAGLSQIGEFSFIVGQAGIALGVLSQEQYSLILAGALISILVNPLMFRSIPLAEKVLLRLPIFSHPSRNEPADAPADKAPLAPVYHRALDQLLIAAQGIEIAWIPVSSYSPLRGSTIAHSNLRATVGTSIIALMRDGDVVPNPKSQTPLLEGDIVGLIGNPQELEAARQLLNPPELLPA